MITKKLYQTDVYQRECDSTVLRILGQGTLEDPTVLVLDQTVFFPTGGGQPCDLGTINGISLADVYEKDGVVLHKLKCEGISSGSPDFSLCREGDTVHSVLDWNRRFLHMQRHCGEHILSGIFFRECGGVNRGFHMGESYMTIDIDVPEIPWEDALHIEYLTNQVIWSNVPVTTRYFACREDAEKLPLRKPLAIDEEISIVCVGSKENPADCVACCGTHPATSGQVGMVKLLKAENYKGMTRVYFKAGEEAYFDYRNKHQLISALNTKYSSDDDSLMEKIRLQEEKSKTVRQELYLIKNAFLASAAEEIIKEQAARRKNAASPSAHTVTISEYPYFSTNDLLALSKKLAAQTKYLAVLISTNETTVILASSGEANCGKIVKDNAGVWNGKGGGNATSARAMFPTMEDLNCFVTFIRQAYS